MLAENVVDVQVRNCLVLRVDPECALSMNIQFKRKQSYSIPCCIIRLKEV